MSLTNYLVLAALLFAIGAATVLHLESSSGRSPDQLAQALPALAPCSCNGWHNRLSAGLTHTTASKLTLTAEYHHNGAGLDGDDWRRLRQGPAPAYALYRQWAASAQEMPTRRAVFLHGTWQDALLPRLDLSAMHTLDLTGGAPELHPRFRELVRHARGEGIRVIDRCNLTILSESGQEDLADFLAENEVEVVASLPCYSAKNVDAQRGDGVFERSIAGLKQLNALGYGQPGSGRVLNLVYNPLGASLPPAQGPLEAAYKRELFEHFGIVFNQLFALANMPIQRFGSMLISKGQFNGYLRLLKDNHRDANLAQVMCRSLISVDWLGRLYDCDFNQQLDLPMGGGDEAGRRHLRDLLQADADGAPIRVAEHCYGCTAGNGSSCGGALGG